MGAIWTGTSLPIGSLVPALALTTAMGAMRAAAVEMVQPCSRPGATGPNVRPFPMTCESGRQRVEVRSGIQPRTRARLAGYVGSRRSELSREERQAIVELA